MTRFERSACITETILFGKYRLLSVLGTGSSSCVYLAEHLKLNVYRAIKCIPKDTTLVTSPSLEALLLKNLHHSGIPIIYDIEEDTQFFYVIEEFVSGESIDVFTSHQNFSHELLLKFGIQLCEILDYLHHAMPYPILYQDLKPEHIIVCGNQIKLVDFGISSFFTGFGQNYQIYGTADFTAPEVLAGKAVTPLSDIFSLGKILEYLQTRTTDTCSDYFYTVVLKATAKNAENRYETAHLLKKALEKDLKPTCPSISHLTKKITVYGSKHGIGTTHIAISLVSILNQNNYFAVYEEMESKKTNHFDLYQSLSFHEQNGLLCYHFFYGLPNYGKGIVRPDISDCILVKDGGAYEDTFFEADPEQFYLFVLSPSPWDMECSVKMTEKFSSIPQSALLCNYGHKQAAKTIAQRTGRTVYCFPFDNNAFFCTAEKKQLFFHIFSLDGRKKRFLNFKKRLS